MRLYPSVPTIPRKAVKNFTIPHSDLTVAKNTQLWIPIYSIHRDTRFYRSPNDFNPNNFMSEVVEGRPENAFLPFTENHPVITESVKILVKLVTAILFENFSFKTDWIKTKIPLEFDRTSLNLDVNEKIWVEVASVKE